MYNLRSTEEKVKQTIKDGIRNPLVSFIGWAEEFRGTRTKCLLICCEHGIWNTSIAQSLKRSESSGCWNCGLKIAADIKNNKLLKYLETVKIFPEGTKFERVPTSETNGRSKVKVICSVCHEQNICHTDNLKRGFIPCSCSKRNKAKYLYIFRLVDEFDNLKSMKVGITKNLNQRASNQSSKNTLRSLPFIVWEFENFKDCRDAEKYCLINMDTGYVDKNICKDGHTETFAPKDTAKLIEIILNLPGKSRLIFFEKDLIRDVVGLY